MPDDEEPPQFDLFGGREARDEGMAKVASRSPEYIEGGMALIANLPNGSELTGEEIRFKCIASGLRYHHQNAHGTLIKRAVERGMLRRTGRMVQPKAKPSHGRDIHVYRVRSVIQPLPPVSPSEPPSEPSPVEPPPLTNAYIDVNGRLIHNTCAVEGCPEKPSIVVGSNQLKGYLGMWFCFAHRPNPNA
jgi:hypothetical protein